jgi:hypothetical protein
MTQKDMNMNIKFLIVSMTITLLTSSGISAMQQQKLSLPNASMKGDYTSKNWLMNSYFDRKSIADLTLPGTHDSGTYAYYILDPTSLWARCQSLTIKEQLWSGIRYLDIRVSLEDDGKVWIRHGIRKTNLKLKELIEVVKTFLEHTPSEFVILHMKVEKGDEAVVSGAAEKELYDTASESSVYDRYDIPLVNEVRGKIVYWRRWGQKNDGKGGLWIPFGGNIREASTKISDKITCYYEDKYDLCEGKKSEGIDEKKIIIRNHFIKARESSGRQEKQSNLFVTFTSCIDNRFGSWPRVTAKTINPWLQREVYTMQRAYGAMNFGVIPMDFVNKRLVFDILMCNFEHDSYGGNTFL